MARFYNIEITRGRFVRLHQLIGRPSVHRIRSRPRYRKMRWITGGVMVLWQNKVSFKPVRSRFQIKLHALKETRGYRVRIIKPIPESLKRISQVIAGVTAKQNLKA